MVASPGVADQRLFLCPLSASTLPDSRHIRSFAPLWLDFTQPRSGSSQKRHANVSECAYIFVLATVHRRVTGMVMAITGGQSREQIYKYVVSSEHSDSLGKQRKEST
ncbi:hypothetical protein CLAIMM_03403 isoform 2, partial [Cladophialophora immunda]